MVWSTGRRGVGGSAGPVGAQPTRSTSCGDRVPPSTLSRTTARVPPTSSGWLSGQVARPSAVAWSSTALAASPARSRESVSSEAVPTTSSRAPSSSGPVSCSRVPALNRRAVPPPVPIGSASRLVGGIPAPSVAPLLHSAVSVRYPRSVLLGVVGIADGGEQHLAGVAGDRAQDGALLGGALDQLVDEARRHVPVAVATAVRPAGQHRLGQTEVGLGGAARAQFELPPAPARVQFERGQVVLLVRVGQPVHLRGEAGRRGRDPQVVQDRPAAHDE